MQLTIKPHRPPFPSSLASFCPSSFATQCHVRSPPHRHRPPHAASPVSGTARFRSAMPLGEWGSSWLCVRRHLKGGGGRWGRSGVVERKDGRKAGAKVFPRCGPRVLWYVWTEKTAGALEDEDFLYPSGFSSLSLSLSRRCALAWPWRGHQGLL